MCDAPAMAAHQFIVESSLSQEEAFARVIDLTRVNEWDEGVSGARQVHGTEPGLHARYEVTVKGFDGRPDQVVYELTEVDEPDRFVMVGENEVFRAVDTLVFTAAENGCVLDYHGTLELLGDNPPMTPAQLDSLFPKVAGVAEAGLRVFLNPS